MEAEALLTKASTPLAGDRHQVPLLLTPRLFADARGFFFESWNQRTFSQALGLPLEQAPAFVQDNHSRSSLGVLRGLHYQLPPHPQGKLVRCTVGEIFDVAVDVRCSSPTFGQWVGAPLSADNHQQLWVPEGFAHGFLTLSEHAEVLYKTTDYWSKECERSLRWDDPNLGIGWPLVQLEGMVPLQAEKDAAAPWLADVQAEDLFR